jgi:hypothetical protein
MKGLNAFLWIGTPAVFSLIGFFVWTARHQSDPVSVITTQSADSSAAAHMEAQVRWVHLAAYRQQRRLALNQRCVGGVVVQVDGSTYTQLGSISNPVRCSGQYADQAIR